jgi:hypothetical protein
MLKTNCEKCVFNKNPSCNLGKETFLIANKMFVEGLCRTKVPEKEAGDVICLMSLLEPNFANDNNLSIVAYATNDDDACTAITKLNSIDVSGVNITAVLILQTDKITPPRDAVQALSKFKHKWSIDLLADKLRTEYVIDYAFRFIHTPWFYYPNIDDIDEKLLDAFAHKNLYDNLLAFYTDDKDLRKCIINTTAFNELQGNFEIPWLDKVKSFSNWQNVCKLVN